MQRWTGGSFARAARKNSYSREIKLSQKEAVLYALTNRGCNLQTPVQSGGKCNAHLELNMAVPPQKQRKKMTPNNTLKKKIEELKSSLLNESVAPKERPRMKGIERIGKVHRATGTLRTSEVPLQSVRNYTESIEFREKSPIKLEDVNSRYFFEDYQKELNDDTFFKKELNPFNARCDQVLPEINFDDEQFFFSPEKNMGFAFDSPEPKSNGKPGFFFGTK